ncbi:hypothetical protein ACFCX0_03445 [Streptomyces sp. NPDC056352]
MTAAINAEQADNGPTAHDPAAPQEVSIDDMNLMIPGLIERVEV